MLEGDFKPDKGPMDMKDLIQKNLELKREIARLRVNEADKQEKYFRILRDLNKVVARCEKYFGVIEEVDDE